MAEQPTNSAPTPSGERPARPGETCSCGRPATVVYITAQYGDVPYCGTQHPALETQPVEDGRITAAREALTASSHAVMGGDLGYDAEQVVEALQEAIEGLLEIFDQGGR